MRPPGYVDDKLEEPARLHDSETLRSPQPVGALGHPQHGDADGRMLRVQAGKEAGESWPVRHHHQLADADCVLGGQQRGDARAGIGRVRHDRQYPVS